MADDQGLPLTARLEPFRVNVARIDVGALVQAGLEPSRAMLDRPAHAHKGPLVARVMVGDVEVLVARRIDHTLVME